jgi:hypothetical protein
LRDECCFPWLSWRIGDLTIRGERDFRVGFGVYVYGVTGLKSGQKSPLLRRICPFHFLVEKLWSLNTRSLLLEEERYFSNPAILLHEKV